MKEQLVRLVKQLAKLFNQIEIQKKQVAWILMSDESFEKLIKEEPEIKSGSANIPIVGRLLGKLWGATIILDNSLGDKFKILAKDGTYATDMPGTVMKGTKSMRAIRCKVSFLPPIGTVVRHKGKVIGRVVDCFKEKKEIVAEIFDKEFFNEIQTGKIKNISCFTENIELLTQLSKK